MKEMIKKIEKAMVEFSKWDWTVTFAGDDEETYEASSRSEAMNIPNDVAREKAMQYAEDVFDAVESANGSAMDAIDAIKAGALSDALLHLKDAAAEERTFGDSPAYDAAITVLQEYLEEED
jgi:hypothetical protein